MELRELGARNGREKEPERCPGTSRCALRYPQLPPLPLEGPPDPPHPRCSHQDSKNRDFGRYNRDISPFSQRSAGTVKTSRAARTRGGVMQIRNARCTLGGDSGTHFGVQGGPKMRDPSGSSGRSRGKSRGPGQEGPGGGSGVAVSSERGSGRWERGWAELGIASRPFG